MNYDGNTEIIGKRCHEHQENLCIAMLSIIPLRKTIFLNKGYFYSGSFQGLFKDIPQFFNFQGHDAFSRPMRTIRYESEPSFSTT